MIYKLFTNELGDIFRVTLKIKEDIEFQKWIIVKLKPEKFSYLKTKWMSPVWTLKTNT
jgi:hypothetical protein